MDTLERPALEEVGDAYRFTWDGLPIVVELCRLEESHGAVSAEITITEKDNPTNIYESGTLNLSAMQTRTTLGNNLKRDANPTIDWIPLLKQVCLLATRQFRTAKPAILMPEYEDSVEERWFLQPYIEREGFSILYADGGSGKSILALAMAAGIATGKPTIGRLTTMPRPVLYLDWETGPNTQYRRLRALARAMNTEIPRVYYRHMTHPLTAQAYQIRSEIAERRIGAVIIDSLGASAEGPIEESAVALALGSAINSFRVPIMAVHHKPKMTDGKRGAQAMFGSVYFANYCRLAWEITAVTYEGENRTDVQFVNTKNNNGAREKRHALTMQFTNDNAGNPLRIDIRPTQIRDIPEFDTARPLAQQIADLLLRGPMTPKELANELTANGSSVRAALSRLHAQGKAQRVANDKWGMTSVPTDDPPF